MVRGLPQVGDVVLTVEAPLGEVAQLRDSKVALAQRIVTLRGKKGVLDNGFLKYFLQSNGGQAKLRERETGTTVTGIKQSELRLIEIDLPPFPVQRRIASILSSIDDKIKLNHQTNQTLEAIMQAIFKEWFVCFDFPGATSNKQSTELGEIPKEWRIGKLGDVCDLIYGKALKADTRVEGEYAVVGSSGIVGSHNQYLVEGPGIVIGRKGTIGEVVWLHKSFYPIDTTFYIKDNLGSNALYYHYFLLKAQDFKKIMSDSAVPGLNRNQAMDNLVVIPDLNIIREFGRICKAFFDMIYNNEEQNRMLIQLRDTLLPKLMKGEIPIPEM